MIITWASAQAVRAKDTLWSFPSEIPMAGKESYAVVAINMLTNLLPKKMPPEKNGRGVQTAGKSMTR